MAREPSQIRDLPCRKWHALGKHAAPTCRSAVPPAVTRRRTHLPCAGGRHPLPGAPLRSLGRALRRRGGRRSARCTPGAMRSRCAQVAMARGRRALPLAPALGPALRPALGPPRPLRPRLRVRPRSRRSTLDLVARRGHGLVLEPIGQRMKQHARASARPSRPARAGGRGDHRQARVER